MHPEIHSLTVDTTGDPFPVAKFWSELLGRPMDDDDKPGDPAAIVQATATAPRILFLRVPDAKSVKNRLHLDLAPVGRTRDEEVERALALGATLHDDQRRPDGTGWVTLADPEGNEFCVERSRAERGEA
jgi:predicted enzyme related to lactoylglutathione lyase